MSVIRATPDGVELTLHVTPRSSRNRIQLDAAHGLRVHLTAPPVDGKANDALIRFLADSLNVPRRTVTLVAGETSRTKRVRVTGLDEGAVRTRLGVPP